MFLGVCNQFFFTFFKNLDLTAHVQSPSAVGLIRGFLYSLLEAEDMQHIQVPTSLQPVPWHGTGNFRGRNLKMV